LVKTDASGNLVWSKTYGGTSQNYVYSVIQTSDGGYAITGSTSNFAAGAIDVYFVKTEVKESLVWCELIPQLTL
jgi:hypothetical protein